LPSLAHTLPKRSGSNHQDQCHRRDQHAGAGDAGEGQDPPGLDLGGLRRPAVTPLHPQPESYRGNVNPIGPRACYDEGKRFAETLFFDYYRQHNLRIRVVRIFNTYGPRMHPNDGRVVSNFIVQALKGEPITLYSDGSQTRAFCYVDDLVEGFLRMMDAPDDITGPMNLGNPVETSVAELAELVIDITGSGSQIVRQPLPIDDPIRRCPDISQASALLNWKAHTPLRQGLQRTVAYFENLLSSEGASN
jgi:UDP-glucuronate decarboxylase